MSGLQATIFPKGMPAIKITPMISSYPHSNHITENATVYEIVQTNRLPIVDLSRPVKEAIPLCQAEWIPDRLTVISSQWNERLAYLYGVSLVLFLISLLLHPDIGQYIAILSFLLGFPSAITILLFLRLDVAYAIVHTYEFWFFSSVNFFTFIILAIYLSDIRILGLIVYWCGMQNYILIDANVHAIRAMTMIALLSVPCLVILSASCVLNLVQEAQDFSDNIFPRRLSAITMASNGLLTLAVFLCRIVYRNREELKKKNSTGTVMCAVYQARLKLKAHFRQKTMVLNVKRRASFVSEMTLVKPEAMVNANKMIFACINLAFIQHFVFWKQILFHLMGFIGFLLSLIAFFLPLFSLQVIGFLLTVFYCTIYGLFWQKYLFKKLFFSFDFIFPSVQVTFAYISICDCFYWDSRVFACFSCWLWIHWMMTLDAITPIVKKKFNLRMKMCLFPLMLTIMSSHIWLLTWLVSDTKGQLQNRSLGRPTFFQKQVMELHVGEFLTSRLLTMILWDFRVLWKIWSLHQDDLMIIQGRVHYYNYSAVNPERKGEKRGSGGKPSNSIANGENKPGHIKKHLHHQAMNRLSASSWTTYYVTLKKIRQILRK